MLREKSSFIADIQKAADIGITALSFIAAYFIKRNLLPGNLSRLSIDPNYYIVLLLIIISWFIAFKWTGMYRSYRQSQFWDFFINIIKACFLGTVLLNIALYVLHIKDISRLLIGIFLTLDVGLLTLWHFIVFKTLEKIRSDGFNTRHVLIVGSGERARQIIDAVDAHKGTGYHVLGCFENQASKLGQTVKKGHKVIGLIKDLEAFLRDNIVDELIFATSLTEIKKADRYVAFAESMGIKVRIIPDWELHYLMYRPDIATIQFEQFLGIYNMALQSTPQNEGKLLIKTVFDFTAAVLLTIILLPLMLLIALAIKIFSDGPVLYTQERLGMNGRKFQVYKFRTMVKNADEMLKELMEMNEADGPAFKIKNDPRIIPWVGSFLRRTSLDELPQLINVLKGEMSLVGPRPPIPKEVDEYSVWHRRRLSMKPGMTCLWQIAPNRNDLSFEDWMKLDLKYIDTWSLFNDFKILVLTVRAVVSGSGR